MGGPDAAHYAALAAVVQASPYLMQCVCGDWSRLG